MSSSSALALASVAAQIQTAGQLRVAMGAVAQILQQGYTALAWTGPATSLPNLLEGTTAAAKSLLDTVNQSAQLLYNIYPTDGSLDDQDISTAHAINAGQVLSEANDAVTSVEAAIGTNVGNVAQFVQDALTASGQLGGQAVQSVTNAVAAAGAAFVSSAWPTLLIIGVGVGIYLFRKPLLRALGGAIT